MARRRISEAKARRKGLEAVRLSINLIFRGNIASAQQRKHPNLYLCVCQHVGHVGKDIGHLRKDIGHVGKDVRYLLNDFLMSLPAYEEITFISRQIIRDSFAVLLQNNISATAMKFTLHLESFSCILN
jgi:hypothetical protein